ncbi:MAG: SRPBCC family protein [Burkholderiales bacterium]
MKLLRLALVALGCVSTGAFAESSWNTLNTYVTVEVNAPAAKAFGVVSKWDALESWCPAFVKTEIVSGGTAVGSVRAITLKDGPTFTEELLSADDSSYRYKIIESPLPIVEYDSTVRVVALGSDKSAIVWLSSYKRRAKDNPTKESDDAAMMNLVGGLYKACLGNAKKVAEGR